MDLETAAPTAAAHETHPVRFSGDGGVYMGVWLVNLLLTVVTLSLYTPFARRRTLKYFYAHTLVAGSPLEFTGGLRRMVFGFLLFFGWYVAYSIAVNTEQGVATALLGGFWIVVSPWLWASAVRFRVHSTRWRGIQGRFQIRWSQAYVAHWPLLPVTAAGVGIYFLVGAKPPIAVLVGAAIAFTVLLLLALVGLDFNFTRLRLLHTSFAGLSNSWTPRLADFVRFWAGAFGIFAAVVALVAGSLALGLMALRGSGALDALRGVGAPDSLAAMVMVVIFGIFIGTYFAMGPALAYREARKFKLLWSHIAIGGVAHFQCDLSVWGYVRLRLRNMLLTLVTMGFWRPFTVTSEYQRRLESVTLHVHGSLDALVGQYRNPQGAFGDAIADAVGFDAIG
jgi:uncharacterized membrane protein YjgN (DUF898 family)